MTKEATTSPAAPTSAPDDPFVGREWVACRGPRARSAVRVVRHLPRDLGDRFEVEGEKDGHRWTVSRDTLARIFGPSAKRRCGCYPLAAATSEDAAAVVAEDAPPQGVTAPHPEPDVAERATESPAAEAEATPDEEHAGAPDETSHGEEVAEPQREAAHESPSSRVAAEPPATFFHNDSRQGALF